MNDKKTALDQDQNKYQNILDQYSKQLNSSTNETNSDDLKDEDPKSLKDINSLQIEAPEPVLGLPETDQEDQAIETLPESETVTQSPIIPEPEIEVIPQSQPEPVVDLKEEIPQISTSELAPDINEVKSQVDEILNYQTRTDNSDESIVPIENNSSNLPKILFFVSLSIFILIIGALAYFLTSGSKPTGKSDSIPTVTPTASEAACTLNGLSLGIGQSFKSADGCNTCSCTAPNVIACTEMACEITPTISATKSATITPTKSATVSSTKTSTKSATPTIKK